MIIIFRDFSEKPTNFDENSVFFEKKNPAASKLSPTDSTPPFGDRLCEFLSLRTLI